MDASRFDALTKSFALSSTRRPLLLVLLASLWGLGDASAWIQVSEARNTRNRQRAERKRVAADAFGGQAVPAGKYPFVVSIGEAGAESARSAHFCGGSLIAPSFVLTAAHCAVDIAPENLELIIGRTDLNSTQGERRGVSAITIHPAYINAATNTNDVALFRLSQPVTSVQPIVLVSVGDQTLEQPDTPLTIVGWGDIREWTGYSSDRGVYPEQMHERAISVVSDEVCDRQWSGKKKQKKGKKNTKKGRSSSGITEDLVVCTTAGVFGYGDSGGPIFASQAGGFVHVTLVSGGDRYKGPDYGPQLSAPPIHDFISSVISTSG